MALAERDGVRVILVLLNAPKRFAIAVRTLDRAFAELPDSPGSAPPDDPAGKTPRPAKTERGA